MIVYLEKSDEIYQNLSQLIIEFSKVAEYMLNLQKSIVFLCVSCEKLIIEIRKGHSVEKEYSFQ